MRPWYKPPMPSEADSTEREYVLGTHDAEVERLRFQHRIWRDAVGRAWSAAGIGPGSRVVDVGAGPGFASIDLAGLVGPSGEVLAVERSRRFLDILSAESRRLGLRTVRTHEIDLMLAEIPTKGADVAWCRWVACFVPDPALLVDRIACCLRSGGIAVFHEYVEYESYRLIPPRPEVESFVEAVFESWRAEGGEPNIARELPRLLSARGFRIESVRAIVRTALPAEELWNWPAGFARINARRLAETGRRDARWADGVVNAIDDAERDPSSVFITPTVLEIIASAP